jgi:hypothetical protein
LFIDPIRGYSPEIYTATLPGSIPDWPLPLNPRGCPQFESPPTAISQSFVLQLILFQYALGLFRVRHRA